jgi:uracil-DNA glycosylase
MQSLINYLHDPAWRDLLKDEFEKDYMRDLEANLKKEYDSKTIYPKAENIFAAFNLAPFEKVKVVIIGQDPYHGPNQAHGLCFSVQKGVKIPPSLVNIYKELESDLGIKPPSHGSLESWASEGVLLLNSLLTVADGSPNSHKNLGWDIFTDRVIDLINEKKQNVVFLLWGAPAQKKASKVDSKKHCVLKTVHPSPLSSYRGYFGCQHFSKCNEFLKSKGITAVDWKVPADL